MEVKITNKVQTFWKGHINCAHLLSYNLTLLLSKEWKMDQFFVVVSEYLNFMIYVHQSPVHVCLKYQCNDNYQKKHKSSYVLKRKPVERLQFRIALSQIDEKYDNLPFFEKLSLPFWCTQFHVKSHHNAVLKTGNQF